MLDFLLKKAAAAKKKVEATMERVEMDNSKFPSSTVMIYEIEGYPPICKVMFKKDKENDK